MNATIEVIRCEFQWLKGLGNSKKFGLVSGTVAGVPDPLMRAGIPTWLVCVRARCLSRSDDRRNCPSFASEGEKERY